MMSIFKKFVKTDEENEKMAEINDFENFLEFCTCKDAALKARLLYEAKHNPEEFFNTHEELHHVLVYPSQHLYVGLLQHYLEENRNVCTVDWKAGARYYHYALAKCGMPREIGKKINFEDWEQYANEAILCRIGMWMEENTQYRLFIVAPEFDDNIVVGLILDKGIDILINLAQKVGVTIKCVDTNYAKETNCNLDEEAEENRLGFDLMYKKQDTGGNTIGFQIVESKYCETGRIKLEDTPLGVKMSPEWIKNILKLMGEEGKEILKAYEEDKVETVLYVITGSDKTPIKIENPFERFGS